MNRILRRIPVIFKTLLLYAVIGVLIAIPFIQNKNEHLRIERERQVVEARLRDSKTEEVILEKLIQGRPSRLLIPSVDIDLAIMDGSYDPVQKRWLVNGDKIHYVTNTPFANNKKGNTILYGHYYQWVLGKTDKLKRGDTLYIFTANDKVFKYKLIKSEIVQPNVTDVFKVNTEEPVISLITCEGRFAQARRLMYFKFVEVA